MNGLSAFKLWSEFVSSSVSLSLSLSLCVCVLQRTWSRYWDIQRSTLQVVPTSLSKVNTLLQVMTVGLSLGAPLMDATHHPLLQTLWSARHVVHKINYFIKIINVVREQNENERMETRGAPV